MIVLWHDSRQGVGLAQKMYLICSHGKAGRCGTLRDGAHHADLGIAGALWFWTKVRDQDGQLVADPLAMNKTRAILAGAIVLGAIYCWFALNL
jgi:hypothetical protein